MILKFYYLQMEYISYQAYDNPPEEAKQTCFGL